MSKAIDFLPAITGSFAQPAAENPTVAMIEAAYQHHGLHLRYLNCEVSHENLKAAIEGAKAMGWTGFNCSIPHKIAVIPHLDGLGESAQLIGAVNTVVKSGEKWIGENTDGKGFLKALRTVTDPKGKKITLFGAGGAARAIGVELALAGAGNITIVNITKEKGNELVDLLNQNTETKAVFHHWNRTYVIDPATEIVINATSVGLFPKVEEHLNINFDSLGPDMIITDVIPNPPETHFIKIARSKGCQFINGLQMLVNQGVIAIKYWTGEDVDQEVMLSTLKEVLNI
ncbi:shikimate dehydrogenase [Chryseobacterium sp. P1-3]|uniref:shikimate dehydrogenase n=1 Tax=Chryseobacterium sp. (strain P1-3) TaxID=1517683 RepID=UPI0004E73534|nr:shikimate dehydrogenase [Chryseobacterium sp. P1-3]KFF73689.1 shikimate dehydrogenase [Chryseobacterium sp. P1-3]